MDILVILIICAEQACNPGPRRTRRIIVLEQEYFCFEGLPSRHWKTVVMDVDTKSGELWCQVNDGPRVKVFQGLPTQQRLYPCMMAVNKGQLEFELLNAALL
jgi:hypothetical protein